VGEEVNYLLAFVFGLLGALAAVRALEGLLAGHVLFIQAGLALGGLWLAVKNVQKARRRRPATAPKSE
jgi:hypothetical protein